MTEIASIGKRDVDAQQVEAMPHSIEAEQQLLGALLTNNDLYDKVADLIGEQHFFDPVHARIFE
ncbi:MAG: DnaB-like helicase N-terminal domain-containing protein, partial [Pseudomonadota bacterium]